MVTVYLLAIKEEALEKKPEEEREKFKAALLNTYKALYNDNSENKEEK